MKVENMIYAYIAICMSLIAYNCVYVFIIRRNAKKLTKETSVYDFWIKEQLLRLDLDMPVSERHKKRLCRKLKTTANLTAFDKSMENLYAESPEKAKRYLYEIYSVFMYLTMEYQGRDAIKAAYFPYIVSKYGILTYKEIDIIAEVMFNLLRSEHIYCRENALRAIYSTGRCEYVVKALQTIDKNLSFHHPKLICDGLLRFQGDREALCKMLWEAFDTYSEKMQLNILNYFRFAGLRCDDSMYAILADEGRNQELRFSAIRYFEKFPSETACPILQGFAENNEGRIWEYQAIASSALKSYPGERTTAILKKNLANSNWYVRLNSAISCERLGFSYADLIQVFDGNDRYAREMLRYRLERREAEKEVVTA